MTLSILETIQANEFACNLCNQACSSRPDNPDLKVCLDCLPDPSDLPYSCCPKCGWDTERHHEVVPEYSNRSPNWEHGRWVTWTETWNCPECGTVFKLDQSNL